MAHASIATRAPCASAPPAVLSTVTSRAAARWEAPPRALDGMCFTGDNFFDKPVPPTCHRPVDDFAPVTPNRRPYEMSHDYESPSGMRVRHIRRGHDDPEWVLPAMRIPPPPPLSAFGIYDDEMGPVPPLFGWGTPATPPARSSSIGIKRRAASDLADSCMLDFYHPGVVRVGGCSIHGCAHILSMRS